MKKLIILVLMCLTLTAIQGMQRTIERCPICTTALLHNPEHPEVIAGNIIFGDGQNHNCNDTHLFHIDCLVHWLQEHTSCPLCHAQLRPHPLEDVPAVVAAAIHGRTQAAAPRWDDFRVGFDRSGEY